MEYTRPRLHPVPDNLDRVGVRYRCAALFAVLHAATLTTGSPKPRLVTVPGWRALASRSWRVTTSYSKCNKYGERRASSAFARQGAPCARLRSAPSSTRTKKPARSPPSFSRNSTASPSCDPDDRNYPWRAADLCARTCDHTAWPLSSTHSSENSRTDLRIGSRTGPRPTSRPVSRASIASGTARRSSTSGWHGPTATTSTHERPAFRPPWVTRERPSIRRPILHLHLRPVRRTGAER